MRRQLAIFKGEAAPVLGLDWHVDFGLCNVAHADAKAENQKMMQALYSFSLSTQTPTVGSFSGITRVMLAMQPVLSILARRPRRGTPKGSQAEA